MATFDQSVPLRPGSEPAGRPDVSAAAPGAAIHRMRKKSSTLPATTMSGTCGFFLHTRKSSFGLNNNASALANPANNAGNRAAPAFTNTGTTARLGESKRNGRFKIQEHGIERKE